MVAKWLVCWIMSFRPQAMARVHVLCSWERHLQPPLLGDSHMKQTEIMNKLNGCLTSLHKVMHKALAKHLQHFTALNHSIVRSCCEGAGQTHATFQCNICAIVPNNVAICGIKGAMSQYFQSFLDSLNYTKSVSKPENNGLLRKKNTKRMILEDKDGLGWRRL